MPRFRHDLSNCFAVALAELRSIRRLTRSWVFLGLGFWVCGTAFVYYSTLHIAISGADLDAANLLPRFTLPYFGRYVLWFLMAALVFLAFDLGGRDERAHIAEVVGSRPLSNVALLSGRLAAVAVTLLVPLFGIVLAIQALGHIGASVGWPIHPLEGVVASTFLLVDAVPAVTLWGAFVVMLAVVVRNRLIVAIAALGILGVHIWSYGQVPSYLLQAVSLLYVHDNWASDLAPRFPDAHVLLHRTAMLLLAAACVLWASVYCSRADGASRRKPLLFAGILAGLAFVGFGAVVLRSIGEMDLHKSWLAAHRSVAGEPTHRIEHLRAEVRIDPGRELRLALDADVKIEGAGTRLVYSFNPALEVAELRLNDTPVPFRHEEGLLIVELPEPLVGRSRAQLSWRATGIPDPDFAYLDSVVDWRRVSGGNSIRWLGTAGSIFDRRYVALMPGMRWLPVPGPNLEGVHRGQSPTIDMTVEVPTGWLVAGPGLREHLGNGRYRFRPVARVPEVGTVRGAFRSSGDDPSRHRTGTARSPVASRERRLLRRRHRGVGLSTRGDVPQRGPTPAFPTRTAR